MRQGKAPVKSCSSMRLGCAMHKQQTYPLLRNKWLQECSVIVVFCLFACLQSQDPVCNHSSLPRHLLPLPSDNFQPRVYHPIFRLTLKSPKENRNLTGCSLWHLFAQGPCRYEYSVSCIKQLAPSFQYKCGLVVFEGLECTYVNADTLSIHPRNILVRKVECKSVSTRDYKEVPVMACQRVVSKSNE